MVWQKIHGPLKLLTCCAMSSVTFTSDVAVKPLLFATETDALVPYASSVRLSKAYPLGCELVAIPDIDHSGFWYAQSVLEAMKNYIQGVTTHE